jgi:hypothetical protein
MEISQNFWQWTIPLDSHEKRDRRELGNSRFAFWTIAQRSKIFFFRNSWHRSLLHQVFPNTTTANAANNSTGQYKQPSFSENGPAATHTVSANCKATAIKPTTMVEAKRSVIGKVGVAVKFSACQTRAVGGLISASPVSREIDLGCDGSRENSN